VIGFLNASSPELTANLVRAFRQGLAEAGYVEGRGLEIDYLFAYDQNDRLPGLATELVRRQVKVIAATGAAVLPAKAATATIPIVFQVSFDPVVVGLVASLNRPGRNMTGVVTLGVEVGPKRLELMRELIPSATRFALLVNPTDLSTAAGNVIQELQMAARTLAVELHVLHASTERELETTFANFGQLSASGLVLANNAFLSNRSELIAALALRYMVPTISSWREFTAAGGLMSYGGSLDDNLHLVGNYTGRILKGERRTQLS
jgi:putative ABC transport system substrate-binding protein